MASLWFVARLFPHDKDPLVRADFLPRRKSILAAPCVRPEWNRGHPCVGASRFFFFLFPYPFCLFFLFYFFCRGRSPMNTSPTCRFSSSSFVLPQLACVHITGGELSAGRHGPQVDQSVFSLAMGGKQQPASCPVRVRILFPVRGRCQASAHSVPSSARGTQGRAKLPLPRGSCCASKLAVKRVVDRPKHGKIPARSHESWQ